jgi:rfaE bifunctional protein kinase chain/domain
LDPGANELKHKAQQKTAPPSMDLRALAEYVEQFSSKTIVVLGDFVADVFEFGEISRVSREAPVLILRHRETQLVPGGGANAVNNLADLGAKVLPVTVIGDDSNGNALIQYFRQKKLDTSRILRVKNWCTPTKTRFLAGWAHTVGQQVLRVDREPQTPLPDESRKKLSQLLFNAIKTADALAISDYGFGVATPALVFEASSKSKMPLPITLDARHNLHAYSRSRITTATPNEAELESQHHTSIGENVEELARAGHATFAAMKLNSLLVTRGRHGMALFESGKRLTHIPVHGSDQSVDVTGAGDTVLATFTLALACLASPLEAAHLANIAGALVVMKRGTATVTGAELLAAIHDQVAGVSA